MNAVDLFWLGGMLVAALSAYPSYGEPSSPLATPKEAGQESISTILSPAESKNNNSAQTETNRKDDSSLLSAGPNQSSNTEVALSTASRTNLSSTPLPTHQPISLSLQSPQGSPPASTQKANGEGRDWLTLFIPGVFMVFSIVITTIFGVTSWLLFGSINRAKDELNEKASEITANMNRTVDDIKANMKDFESRTAEENHHSIECQVQMRIDELLPKYVKADYSTLVTELLRQKFDGLLFQNTEHRAATADLILEHAHLILAPAPDDRTGEFNLRLERLHIYLIIWQTLGQLFSPSRQEQEQAVMKLIESHSTRHALARLYSLRIKYQQTGDSEDKRFVLEIMKAIETCNKDIPVNTIS